jgi:hypothetical protein
MLRLKPVAWWVLPWGLLAGMILTLLFLGSQTWKPLTDCGQRASPPYSLYSPPGGCFTLEEGYPVRFLSSYPVLEQNPGTSSRPAGLGASQVISKVGLGEDWLIWSAASCLVLYLLSARKTAGKQDQTPAPMARV